MAKPFFVRHDLHRPSAENERRSHKNGITDLFGNLHSFFDLRDGFALRLGNAEFQKKFFKRVSVFRLVDRVAIGSYDFNAALCERFGKVDRRLPAEREAITPSGFSRSMIFITSSGVNGSK